MVEEYFNSGRGYIFRRDETASPYLASFFTFCGTHLCLGVFCRFGSARSQWSSADEACSLLVVGEVCGGTRRSSGRAELITRIVSQRPLDSHNFSLPTGFLPLTAGSSPTPMFPFLRRSSIWCSLLCHP